MQFFLRHKKLHIVLAAELFLLGLYLFFRQFRPLMNFLASHVTVPLRRGIGSICYLVDFSVAEALCVALVIAGAAYLIWSVAAVCRARGRRAGRAYSAVLGLLCAGLGIYVGFCFLLGIDSYADGFQEKSGIYAQPVEEAALRDVTAYFADALSQAAGRWSGTRTAFSPYPGRRSWRAAPASTTRWSSSSPFLPLTIRASSRCTSPAL